MADANAVPVERTEITDAHRKVVFSFLKLVRDMKVEDPDGLEVASQILASAFGIDQTGFGGQFDSDVDLLAVFEAGQSSESDEKFKAFLDLLKKKGYFANAEEGSDEWKLRETKARAKFAARNNPYEGLGAEELKAKGNELMKATKYKESIGFYTKAIELDPSVHIYYANRAAAHTHLKDYRSAIIDCEKCIAINDKYSKAYSRLGTALFYDGNYPRAVDAYSKAAELDPENENYKVDLKQAQEKLATQAPAAGAGGVGFPGMPGMPPGMAGMPGMGGAGGMPDMSNMMQMMNNPQFMNMANNMMQDPNFAGMVQNMAGNMGQTAPNPEQMQNFVEGLKQGGAGGAPGGARPPPDAEGNIQTPFGKINQSELEKMQEEEIKSNPKFAAIMDDVKVNGPAAFQKYMGDPEVMQLMTKFQGMMTPGQGPAPGSE